MIPANRVLRYSVLMQVLAKEEGDGYRVRAHGREFLVRAADLI